MTCHQYVGDVFRSCALCKEFLFNGLEFMVGWPMLCEQRDYDRRVCSTSTPAKYAIGIQRIS